MFGSENVGYTQIEGEQEDKTTAEGSTRGHSTINAINILNRKIVSLQHRTQSIFFGQIHGYLQQTKSHLIGKNRGPLQKTQSHLIDKNRGHLQQSQAIDLKQIYGHFISNSVNRFKGKNMGI